MSNTSQWVLVVVFAVIFGALIANTYTINKLKKDNNLK